MNDAGYEAAFSQRAKRRDRPQPPGQVDCPGAGQAAGDAQQHNAADLRQCNLSHTDLRGEALEDRVRVFNGSATHLKTVKRGSNEV